MNKQKEVGKYLMGIAFLAIAIVITIYTPLFDQSRLLLPFSAVLLSYILLDKRHGIFVSLLALLAIDFFLIGAPRMLQFDYIYIVEAIIFLVLGYLINKPIEDRKKADEKLLQLKDEFIFTTAHDLRSPFQLITLILDKYRYEDVSPEETKKDMAQIKDSIGSSLNLINKLLALAKGEDPYKQKERFDLQELIEKLLVKRKIEIKMKNVTVEHKKLALPVHIISNPIAVEEIFDNLIGNAVKYNNDNGRIIIEHTTDSGKILTSVTDTGVGIPEENLKNIFLPYYRTNQTKESGTGLGLYIVKKTVDQIGGSIRIDSQPGKGSTFKITIPAAAEII